VEQGPGRNCCPWREADAGAGFLAGPVAFGGGPMLEQSIPEGLYPVEKIHYRAVCGELQPVGRTHSGEFQKQSVMK